EPAQKRRAEVEAYRRVVVDDLRDAVARVQNARGRIRLVAFRSDALVPVMIGMRGVLRFYRFEPRVLARRLIEMTMNTDEAKAHRRAIVVWHGHSCPCDRADKSVCATHQIKSARC